MQLNGITETCVLANVETHWEEEPFSYRAHGERLNRTALIFSHCPRGVFTLMSYEQVTFFPFNAVSKGKQANQRENKRL